MSHKTLAHRAPKPRRGKAETGGWMKIALRKGREEREGKGRNLAQRDAEALRFQERKLLLEMRNCYCA